MPDGFCTVAEGTWGEECSGREGASFCLREALMACLTSAFVASAFLPRSFVPWSTCDGRRCETLAQPLSDQVRYLLDGFYLIL